MARRQKGPFRASEEQKGLRCADKRNANLKCPHLLHTTDPQAPNRWSLVTSDETEAVNPNTPACLPSIHLASDREGRQGKLTPWRCWCLAAPERSLAGAVSPQGSSPWRVLGVCLGCLCLSVCLLEAANGSRLTDWGFEPVTVLHSFSGLPTSSRQQATENGLGSCPFGSRLIAGTDSALQCVSFLPQEETEETHPSRGQQEAKKEGKTRSRPVEHRSKRGRLTPSQMSQAKALTMTTGRLEGPRPPRQGYSSGSEPTVLLRSCPATPVLQTAGRG